MDKRLTPARIALLYAAFAGLWIFASDKIMAFADPDPAYGQTNLNAYLTRGAISGVLRLCGHHHVAALSADADRGDQGRTQG